MTNGRDITLTTGTGRTLAAFLARPDAAAGPSGHPAVLVVHEAMGLNDDIRRISSQFADNGYVALAPDLIGAGFKPLCIAHFVQGMRKVGTGRPYREMAAFQDWLGRQDDVDADRIGLAGFCMGGGFAMLYAARGGRELRAIAPFYGQVPDEALIPDLCPTVASYGARDGQFGKLGPRLQAGLDAADIPNDVKTYDDAGHSFMSQHGGLLGAISPMMPTHGGYVAAAADDAWARMLAFFGEHLAPRDPGSGAGASTLAPEPG